MSGPPAFARRPLDYSGANDRSAGLLVKPPFETYRHRPRNSRADWFDTIHHITLEKPQ